MRHLERITKLHRPDYKDMDTPPPGMERLSADEALWWASAFNVLFKRVDYVVTWSQEVNNFYPEVRTCIRMNKPCYVWVDEGTDEAPEGAIVIDDNDGYAATLRYHVGIGGSTMNYTLTSYNHAGHGFIVTTYTVQDPRQLSEEQDRAWREVWRTQGRSIPNRIQFPAAEGRRLERAAT